MLFIKANKYISCHSWACVRCLQRSPPSPTWEYSIRVPSIRTSCRRLCSPTSRQTRASMANVVRCPPRCGCCPSPVCAALRNTASDCAGSTPPSCPCTTATCARPSSRLSALFSTCSTEAAASSVFRRMRSWVWPLTESRSPSSLSYPTTATWAPSPRPASPSSARLTGFSSNFWTTASWPPRAGSLSASLASTAASTRCPRCSTVTPRPPCSRHSSCVSSCCGGPGSSSWGPSSARPARRPLSMSGSSWRERASSRVLL